MPRGGSVHRQRVHLATPSPLLTYISNVYVTAVTYQWNYNDKLERHSLESIPPPKIKKWPWVQDPDKDADWQWCYQGLKVPGQGQGLVVRGQGQGQGLVNWSSRTFFEDNNTGLQWRMAYFLTYMSKSVSNTLFTVFSCTVAVTKFMDFTWSYITDCLQNAKSLTIFEDFVVQRQGQGFDVRGQKQRQGLVNWSSRIFEDNTHCWLVLRKLESWGYQAVKTVWR